MRAYCIRQDRYRIARRACLSVCLARRGARTHRPSTDEMAPSKHHPSTGPGPCANLSEPCISPAPLTTALEAAECAAWRNGTRLNPHRGFTSQANQDRQLWLEIFSKLGRPGVYADIAANHYRYISNSYFLDRCAGWSGVCVEPNHIYHSDLKKKRSCALVQTCASNSTAETNLVLPTTMVRGGLGGVAKSVMATRAGAHMVTSHSHVYRQRRCVLMSSVFAQLGVRHIDFLSLDVELHEEYVLQGIDFDAVSIDYVLCENFCERRLPALGYHRFHLKGLKMGNGVGHETLWRHERVPRASSSS